MYLYSYKIICISVRSTLYIGDALEIFFSGIRKIAKTKIDKMKCKYLCEYKACVRTQHQGQYDEKWVLGKCSLLV